MTATIDYSCGKLPKSETGRVLKEKFLGL